MAFSNSTSRFFGFLANTHFPKFMQRLINNNYVRHFNLDMSEFKNPDEYSSLNELFTRSLQIQRKIQDDFISPSDGKILEFGESFKAEDENFAFSIKGFTYSLNELLKNSYEASDFKNGLDYVNIYLAPKDYHRFHSPFDMQILSATYISGELFSVNEKKLLTVANLYTKNERLILKCLVKNFYIWLVFIGAQNVGKIRLNFDESIKTNAKKGNFSKTYDSLFVNKADELGYFEMGSTIVLIAQSRNLSFKLLPNSTVKFGEKIATFL